MLSAGLLLLNRPIRPLRPVVSLQLTKADVMTRRTFSTLAVVLGLAASVGCQALGHHKHKKCTSCVADSGCYSYDAQQFGYPGVMPPEPVEAPRPLAEPQLPPVPPPPTGSAEQPSRVQAMRDGAREFFQNAGNNLRNLFDREGTATR